MQLARSTKAQNLSLRSDAVFVIEECRLHSLEVMLLHQHSADRVPSAPRDACRLRVAANTAHPFLGIAAIGLCGLCPDRARPCRPSFSLLKLIMPPSASSVNSLTRRQILRICCTTFMPE